MNNHSKVLKTYAFVAEVPKLKIPHNNSIKITDFKNNFYLYPSDIIRTLNRLKQSIKNHRNGQKDGFRYQLSFTDVIDTDEEAKTYFVSEFETNLENHAEEILETVKNHFKYLLNLFSFIFREFFYIKTVYIFERHSTFYRFVRMIKTPIFHKETTNSLQLIQLVWRRDTENLFPILLLRLKRNKQYLPFIEEFLFSRIRAGNIIVKFMVGWNTLEHLTNIYWKLRGETKLFEKAKKVEINKTIRNFSKDDIKFPYISSEEIKKRVFFYNGPPILTLIRELCNRIHVRLDDDEFLTIQQVHFIRNHLFHKVYDIHKINEAFSKKFNLNEFHEKEYIPILRKFMLISEKIMLRLFQFIPGCLQIEKMNVYFHYLKWKKMKVYSKRNEKDINQIIIDAREKRNSTKLEDGNFYIRNFLEEKQNIFFRGKYISLLKLINRLDKKIKDLLEKSLIAGEVDTRIHGRRKILLQFKDNLRGIYYSEREDDNTVVNFVRSPTRFISIPHKEHLGFQLEFEMLLNHESSQHSFNRDLIRIEGKFLTLLIDIKEY